MIPSVPKLPQKSLGKSYPATDLYVTAPVLMMSPFGIATFSAKIQREILKQFPALKSCPKATIPPTVPAVPDSRNGK